MAQKGCTHMNEVSPTALCREGLSCALQLREEDDAQRSYEAHVILHDNSSCEAQYRIQEFSFCSPFPLRNVCTFSQRVFVATEFSDWDLKGVAEKVLNISFLVFSSGHVNWQFPVLRDKAYLLGRNYSMLRCLSDLVCDPESPKKLITVFSAPEMNHITFVHALTGFWIFKAL